ncbi:hypothetical protein H5410_045008 [Solanum commersonii]|uniref:Uncharacterized protein n=1 Tax=Solanum commersonii TaxID=4109 RepID=A0A9J5XBE1_SOLCO|nr:hypothetical protein H5410_045008 [Solanum commersonii]
MVMQVQDLSRKLVKWVPPWIYLETILWPDRLGSYGFYLKNSQGDLIYAKAREISNAANKQAEPVAIYVVAFGGTVGASGKSGYYKEETTTIKSHIIHILFREVNSLSDLLANEVVNS